MGSLLTNAPYWFVILLGLLGLAVAYTGLRRQQPTMRTWGLAVIGVAALLVVLRMVLPTDEKRVEQQARDLIAAVSDQKWADVKRLTRRATLSDVGVQGEAIADTIKQVAERFALSGVTVNSLDVRRQPNVITVVISVNSAHKDPWPNSVPSSWDFEYQKRGEGWTLTNIKNRSIGAFGQTVNPQDVMRGKYP